MTSPPQPEHLALLAADAAPRKQPSNYPAPFAARVAGRLKRPLGDPFGLTNFGVNLTRLAPSAMSALHHAHTKQDEFVYVLEGEVTLVTDAGAEPLRTGDCAGFKAGSRDGHHLRNESGAKVVLLVVGGRSDADHGEYSDIDMKFTAGRYSGGGAYQHKDGTPY